MLLAFSARSEELDILMLSLTFGNVEVKKYVRLSISYSCSRSFILCKGEFYWDWSSREVTN